MEKELLFIVTTIKDLCSISVGATMHMFTNNENTTFDMLNNTQRTLRWRSYEYEEVYSPMLHHVEGENYILADNFLRLHCLSTPNKYSITYA